MEDPIIERQLSRLAKRLDKLNDLQARVDRLEICFNAAIRRFADPAIPEVNLTDGPEYVIGVMGAPVPDAQREVPKTHTQAAARKKRQANKE